MGEEKEAGDGETTSQAFPLMGEDGR